MAATALVPELAVTDWRASRGFYCDLIGFSVRYERPEEGFCYLVLGDAHLMIDQVGLGRDLVPEEAVLEQPFGRGLNLQIRVPEVHAMLLRLAEAKTILHLPLEERWYRRNQHEVGHRQFVVADPDGYLLRFVEDLGERPLP